MPRVAKKEDTAPQAVSQAAHEPNVDDLKTENENMVYGGRIWGSGHDTGERTSQLALFRLNPSARIAGYRGNRTDRKWYWLTAVASASRFAICGDYGLANCLDASYADGDGGLRPHFLLY